MESMRKYIKKYWKPFFIAITFLVIESISDLLQPTIMAKIVDIGVANKDMNYVLKLGGVMIGVTAIGAIGAIGRNIVSSNVSQRFGAELRSDLFKKVQSLSLENINNLEIASLITRLTNDVTGVQNFVHRMMRIFVKAPIIFLGSIIMAIILSPPMSLVLLFVVPIVMILIFFNLKIGYPLFRKVQNLLDNVNRVVREYLGGVRVVQAFNRFIYERKRLERANEELTENSTKAIRVMAIFKPSIGLTVNFGIVMVLWFSGISVNNGYMDVGKVIAFTNYMTQILFSFMRISMIFNILVRSRASLERIDEVFKVENTMTVSKDVIDIDKGEGRIDFQDVSFAYKDSSDYVLRDINFTILPGETLGIIGSTGSGKSTLVNLIPRFYDVTNGTIKIDGIDIKNINIKSLREKIAIVPQKTVLFTGTILENIRWGREDAILDEVKKVSKIAKAHDFIKKSPMGYDTVLSQGGVNLSGGQKQRIAIARGLIRNPEILILDDSTSALDLNTEGEIRKDLKGYLNSLTSIIIAQRITSVIGCDKIIVMDDGNIAGIGKHKELINSCEVYKDIFRSQIGKEEMVYEDGEWTRY